MLLLRCWALFENRRVVWVLCGGFVGTTIAGVFVANFIVSRAQYLVNPLPSIFTGCYIVLPDYLWMGYVAPIIYETTLFMLTLWRIRTLAKGVGASPLLETLRANGMAYFGALVVLIVIGWAGTRIHHLKLATNGSGLFTAISSAVCSRMIFSLYEIDGAEILESYADSLTRSNPSNGIMPRFAIPLRSFTTTSQHTM
ncbi:hypothetical protein RSOLAG22IIIB_06344 [Rhizoctonia solani]|uniref:Uncharacterized protein n=1 Tax=Rhizoctonia solani TaxID=456999 RepID=A0A0K6GDL3_9AGAM|nr:hypothetical protein RSOLAG22IIIB_06344 [Rhizoctonia solani]